MPPKHMHPNEELAFKETKPMIGGGRVSGTTRLTSSFDLVEEMTYLFVKIIKARGLPASPLQPFLEVKIGNHQGTTNFFHKSHHQQIPEWNQVFAFNKDKIQASLIQISIKDKDGLLIGCLISNVSDVPRRVIPDSTLAPQWCRLQDHNGLRISGELMLSVWMGTQADESFAEAWLSDSAAVVGGEQILNTRSKIYMTPRLWYLRVGLIKAQDLVPNRTSPEYFVKATLGNLVLRSRVLQIKTLDPDWNEDLMFVAAEPFDDPLVLSVEDKYAADKEECLGKIVIPLQYVEKRILPVTVCPKWYNLKKPVAEGQEFDNEEKFVSRINMSISLDGGYHVLDESTHYSSDFRSSSKHLWAPVVGVLELGILDAKGLVPMKNKNRRQTTDAYCVAKYGHKWVRTKTVVDNLDPKWNEQYTWEVYDPYTVVTIGVFDNVHVQTPENAKGDRQDSRIGKVRIRLSTLVTDKIYTYSYPLLVLQPKGLRKMGEIQLAVRFTCSNYYNMFRTYWQPLLPKMHYSNPLSVYQLESLRHQAAHIVTSRLVRTEPPLRKEVVCYMLDSGANMWSFRRGRANFARFIRFFSIFLEAWQYFRHIRAWKNYWHTFLFFIFFEALVISPGIIIPLVFLVCAVVSLYHLPKRPKHPPHVEARLSYADCADPDELDEEFDTFPSSKSAEVLKVRYDRLRSIGGRMVCVMGDLATQVERLQSLWLVSLLGIYVMRPPRFRGCVPSYAENFLRRLPARTESLIWIGLEEKVKGPWDRKSWAVKAQTFLARKGPLGTVWCAAHLQHRLKKSHYTSTDIITTVDRIMFPEVPIALRMSGHLLLGVARIYSKKVEYLFQDCNAAKLSLRKAFATTDNANAKEETSLQSIILPHTFNLDAFYLDDDTYLNQTPDAHVRSLEDITLPDQNPPEIDPYVEVKTFDQDIMAEPMNDVDVDHQDEAYADPQEPNPNDETAVDDDVTMDFQDPGPNIETEILYSRPDGSTSPQSIPEIEIMRDAVPEVAAGNLPPVSVIQENIVPGPSNIYADQVQMDKDILSPSLEDLLTTSRDFEQHSVSAVPEETPGMSDIVFSFGRSSPNLAIQPSPAVKLPRPRRRKRNVFDEETVLTNRFMQRALNNTSDLLRNTRKLHSSSLDIWKFNNSVRKEQIFQGSSLTGVCSEISNMFDKDYISSKPYLIVPEEPSPEFGIGASPTGENIPESMQPQSPAQSPVYATEGLPNSSVAQSPPDVAFAEGIPNSSVAQSPPRVAFTEVIPNSSVAHSPPAVAFTEAIPNISEPMEIENLRDGGYESHLNIHDDYSMRPSPIASPLRRDSTSPVSIHSAAGFDSTELPEPSTTRSGRTYVSGFETPHMSFEEQIRMDKSTLPDTPELINSQDLNFLEADNNNTTPDAGREGKKDWLPVRSRAVFLYLQKQCSEASSSDLSLNNILQGKTRKLCARMFFDTLVLKTKGLVDVKQEQPYGDITLKLSKRNI
ncbi:hypothetical protein ACFE04_004271 [Oxalis oulophora]